MKNILISNDDGINARGIHALAQSTAAFANVYICAPHTERSATGHGLTMGKDAYIDFTEVPVDGAKLAYAVTGLPADCVKMGLGLLEQKGIEIDYVFSGINHGGNLGTDTVYSGTVSAALEGMICGKSGAAFSVGSHKGHHFDYICDLVPDVFAMLEDLSGEQTPPVVFNVNTPDLPREDIAGTKLTRLGRRDYDDFLFENFEEGNIDRHTVTFQYRGRPVVYDEDDLTIDAIAHQHGYASITPIHHDLTNRDLLTEIRHRHFSLFSPER